MQFSSLSVLMSFSSMSLKATGMQLVRAFSALSACSRWTRSGGLVWAIGLEVTHG